jgi:hypothetical protein
LLVPFPYLAPESPSHSLRHTQSHSLSGAGPLLPRHMGHPGSSTPSCLLHPRSRPPLGEWACRMRRLRGRGCGRRRRKKSGR